MVPFLLSLLLAAQQANAQGRARTKMTASEYEALHHLAYAREGLTPGQLGSRLAITSGGVTHMIDGLEARGLAIRVRWLGGDRRSLTVVATQLGVDLIQHDLTTLLDQTPPPPPGGRLGPDHERVVAQVLALIDQHS